MIDSGLAGREGYHESRRCSRDTYPEPPSILVYEDNLVILVIVKHSCSNCRCQLLEEKKGKVPLKKRKVKINSHFDEAQVSGWQNSDCIGKYLRRG